MNQRIDTVHEVTIFELQRDDKNHGSSAKAGTILFRDKKAIEAPSQEYVEIEVTREIILINIWDKNPKKPKKAKYLPSEFEDPVELARQKEEDDAINSALENMQLPPADRKWLNRLLYEVTAYVHCI